MALQYDRKAEEWSGYLWELSGGKKRKELNDVNEYFNSSEFAYDKQGTSDQFWTQEKFGLSLVTQGHIKSFLNDSDYTEKSLENFKQWLSENTSALDGFKDKLNTVKGVLKTFGSALASMAIQWAIGEIIGLVVTAIDNYVHRVEYAREKTEELLGEFKKEQDTLKEHKKLVEEVGDRYSELAKGVDENTNANLTLSTDEYKEYLDISEKLSDAFPTLNQGIDANGNSILKIGSNALQSKEYLESLLKQEEELANFKIAQDIDESVPGLVTYFEEAQEADVNLEKTKAANNKLLEELNKFKEGNKTLSNGLNNSILSDEYYTTGAARILTALQKSWGDFSSGTRETLQLGGITQASDLFNVSIGDDGSYNIYSNLVGLDNDQLNEVNKIVAENIGNIYQNILDVTDANDKGLQTKLNTAAAQWSDFLPNLMSAIKSKGSFQNIGDLELQETLLNLVGNLDWGYALKANEYNPTDITAYFRDTFIAPISDMSDGVRANYVEAMNDLLTLGTEDIDPLTAKTTADNLIQQIADYLNIDVNDLRGMIGGLDGFDALASRYQENLDAAKEKFKDDENITDGDIENFFTKNIHSEADINNWIEAANAVDTFTEARRRFFNGEKKDAKYSTSIANVSKSSTALDTLGEIYKDVADGGDFNWSNLLNNEDFNNAFGNLDSYEQFVKTISSNSTDIKACQGVFDSLVTEWIDGKDVLGELNDENKETIALQLKQKGIVNAEEVVYNALALSIMKTKSAELDYSDSVELNIALMEEELKQHGYVGDAISDLAATFVEAQSLISEMVANGVADRLALYGVEIEGIRDVATAQAAVAKAKSYYGGNIAQTDQYYEENKEAIEGLEKVETLYKHLDELRVKAQGFKPSGSGSKSDPYEAEIDKLRKYLQAYADAQARREVIDKKYDETESNSEKLPLINERIIALQEEQKALEELSKAREELIRQNVQQLREQGFEVEYDPTSDRLRINNLEHLNDLKGKDQEATDEIIKTYEDLISTTDQMVSDNRDLATAWQDNVYTLKNLNKELLELKETIYDEKVTDIEFKIDVADSLDRTADKIDSFTDKIQETLNSLNEAYNDGLDNTNDYVQKLIKALLDAAEELKDFQLDILNDNKDDYDAAKNAVIQVIDDQIDALNNEKEALQKLNDEEDRALELAKLKEALDKAKQQKIHVYREGKGWVYEQDDEAVREAERNLADYENEQRIQAIDDEIDAWQKYKEQWEDTVDAYQKEADRLKAAQLWGADWEDEILNRRLNNLNSFKDDYYNICKQIADIELMTAKDILRNLGVDPIWDRIFSPEKLQKQVNTYWANLDGTAPSNAKIGDKILTEGGTYEIVKPNTVGATESKITGLWSKKIDDVKTILNKDIAGKLAISNTVEQANDRILDSTTSTNILSEYLLNDIDSTDRLIDISKMTIDTADESGRIISNANFAINTNTTAINSAMDVVESVPEQIQSAVNSAVERFTVSIDSFGQMIYSDGLNTYRPALMDESRIGYHIEDWQFDPTNPYGYYTNDGRYVDAYGNVSKDQFVVTYDKNGKVISVGTPSSGVDKSGSNLNKNYRNSLRDTYIDANGVERYSESNLQVTNADKALRGDSSLSIALSQLKESLSKGYGNTKIIPDGKSDYLVSGVDGTLQRVRLDGNKSEEENLSTIANQFGLDDGTVINKVGSDIVATVNKTKSGLELSVSSLKDNANSIDDNSDALDSTTDSIIQLTDSNGELVSVISRFGTGSYGGSSSSGGSSGGGSSRGGLSADGTYRSSYSESDRNAIKAAQNDYNAAKARGDKAGMSAAHAKAEAIRNSNGDKSGVDGVIRTETITTIKHAKGTGFIKNPHRAVVDDAGDELIVRGQGRQTYLEYGDKVFPHEESKKILSMYDKLSNGLLGYQPIDLFSLYSDKINGTFKSNLNNVKRTNMPKPTTNVFSGTVVLPNVKNYKEFEAELTKRFENMPQRANQSTQRRI